MFILHKHTAGSPRILGDMLVDGVVVVCVVLGRQLQASLDVAWNNRQCEDLRVQHTIIQQQNQHTSVSLNSSSSHHHTAQMSTQ